MFVVEEYIVEEAAPWNLRDRTSKTDRGLSALQRVQDLGRDYGSSITNDVQAVRILTKDSLGD